MDSLSDVLRFLSTVPPLEVDRSNWPIFKRKFGTLMEIAGLETHFLVNNYPAGSYDAVEAKPKKVSGESDDALQKQIDAWKGGENKWKEGVKAWKSENAKARAVLGRVIPDSIYMEISEHRHFYEMWEAVELRFEKIMLRQKSNLRGRLNQMYCNEEDNVVAHLQEMESIYQQLAIQNARVSDEDYVVIIIRSLPRSYSNLMTSLLTMCSRMEIAVTPVAIKDAVQRECGARQVAASRDRRSDETPLHADTTAEPNEATPEKSSAMSTDERRTSNSLSTEINGSGYTRHAAPGRQGPTNCHWSISPKPINAAKESPFVGPGSNKVGPSTSSSSLLEAGGLNHDRGTPSNVEDARRSMAVGSSPSCQRSSRTHLGSRGSLLRPPVNPATPQTPGLTNPEITTYIKARRNSPQEIEYQRVLDSITGDSLSKENLEKYISLLQNNGMLM